MKDNPYIHLLKTGWRYAEGKRKAFVLYYVFSAIGASISMMRPLVFGALINVVQRGGDMMVRDVFLYALLFPIISIASWSFHGTSRVIEGTVAFHVFRTMKESLYWKITQLPISWQKDHHSGETINRVSKATAALKTFMTEGFEVIIAVVQIVVATVAILLLFPLSVAFMLVIGALVLWTVKKFDARLIRFQENINEREHDVSSLFYDYVSNIYTVITLRLEELSHKEFIKKIFKIFAPYKKYIVLNEVKWFFVDFMVTILGAAIVVLYVFWVDRSSQVVMVGTLIILYQYIEKFLGVFYQFTWKYQQLVMQSVDVKTVTSIETAYDQHAEKKVFKEYAFSHWKTIRIQHLEFQNTDQNQKKHRLKDVNLLFERGKKIALVGESGSGKSTLLSVIRGLENPKKVACFIDGNETDFSFLSHITTLIPQDPEIFENTIEYNITAGVTHSAKEIEWACGLAKFTSIVKRLPRGLKTNIQEKGVNLSGGEKQRLALARGIFSIKENSLVLFDEPTSSVDTVNERGIYESIFETFTDACIVSSIHKLHLLPLFDYVYVMQDGKVVEEGNVSTLLKSKGALHTMMLAYGKERA